ncbi:GNAT family N-acetyltransferase [Pseudomonas fulva]|nr:GNAT family N-acetyltransferase [Pseudomonas fulva]
MLALYTPTVGDHPELLQVWEASVRATHDFLAPAYIELLRDQVLPRYLDAVALSCCKAADGRIMGFAGTAEDRLDMLFVAPQYHGQGVGSRLLGHAVQSGARTLDVNEQNPKALGFYLRHGFEVTGRSPSDGLGQPYPLLHMRLATLR